MLQSPHLVLQTPRERAIYYSGCACNANYYFMSFHNPSSEILSNFALSMPRASQITNL